MGTGFFAAEPVLGNWCFRSTNSNKVHWSGPPVPFTDLSKDTNHGATGAEKVYLPKGFWFSLSCDAQLNTMKFLESTSRFAGFHVFLRMADRRFAWLEPGCFFRAMEDRLSYEKTFLQIEEAQAGLPTLRPRSVPPRGREDLEVTLHFSAASFAGNHLSTWIWSKLKSTVYRFVGNPSKVGRFFLCVCVCECQFLSPRSTTTVSNSNSLTFIRCADKQGGAEHSGNCTQRSYSLVLEAEPDQLCVPA